MTSPIALGPGEGTTIEGPAGGPLTFKVRGEQTGGSLTAFENVIAPGDGPPLHVHASEDEAWYVIAGELGFQLGDERAPPPRRARSSSCPAAFDAIGAGVGMDVVGPPLR
jgi:hypothetical protein